MIKLVKKNYND